MIVRHLLLVTVIVLVGVAASCGLTPQRSEDAGTTTRPSSGLQIPGEIHLDIELSRDADRVIRSAIEGLEGFEELGSLVSYKATKTELGIVVDAELTKPVELHNFPGTACTVPHTGPVIGVRWLIDEPSGEVVGFSPVWVDAACI